MQTKIDRSKLSKFIYKGKTYDVFIVKKANVRRTNVRSRDGVIVMTCPKLMTTTQIQNTMKVLIPKFIDKFITDHYKAISFEEHYVYVFGSTIPLYKGDKNVFTSEYIMVKDIASLEKYLKGLLLEYLEVRVKEYAKEMKINPDYYKVRVRKMKTRYGTNSYQTNTLTFQFNLVFYKKDAIDTVIVHELAHYYHPDHSKAFYKRVLKYSPDYFTYQKALKKGKLLNDY